MNNDIRDAIARLQFLSSSSAGANSASACRCDDALDRLLRHPERSGDPRELVRQAQRHARQHFARRWASKSISMGLDHVAGALTRAERTHPVLTTWPPARWTYQDHDELLVLDVIRRLPLAERDRRVIEMLAADLDVKEIAQELGVPLRRAHVIVHRARRRTYALYRKAA